MQQVVAGRSTDAAAAGCRGPASAKDVLDGSISGVPILTLSQDAATDEMLGRHPLAYCSGCCWISTWVTEAVGNVAEGTVTSPACA
ncbi:hypothetical protein GCM10027451_19820 [Geodermatophilus aquaeductus]|uniref:hypothetical protein n=1 Tax=Geodermatophilus aquaeductus TaxID=1564161 RepID=UPI001157B12E|nr:hypothetical protein [Geodermatophilus aquaeductus]